MAVRQVAKRQVWAGLILLLFGIAIVIAVPAGAQSESAGNLDCTDVVAELELVDVVSAKDDTQRTAPFPVEGYFTLSENGLTVSYRLLAGPEDGPEPYLLEFREASAPIFAVFVKQAAEKQELSRSGLFPEGTTAGSVWLPAGEFSHVSFCTGTLPTTTPTSEDPTTTTTTLDVDDGSSTTTEALTPTTVEVDETPSSEPPVGAQQPEAEVRGDVIVRELPRTGAGTDILVAAGVGMILVGGWLVGRNSHRLAG